MAKYEVTLVIDAATLGGAAFEFLYDEDGEAREGIDSVSIVEVK